MSAGTEKILERMPSVGHRLGRQTARQVIADKIKVLIATGMVQAGDALPGERDLAAALNVSRETVRGAIQILSAQGHVEVAQGSRSRVRPIDLSALPVTIIASRPIDSYDLDAVHASRVLIELHVVGEAARRMDAETLAAIESLMTAQREAGDDVTRFLICDREFHVTIYRACGNPLLADLVTDLYAYMMAHRRKAMSELGATRESYADHQEIVRGLSARDPDAVVAAFRSHLTRIYDTTKAIQDRARRAGSDEADRR